MPAPIITFYSYKGGTGRSMSLANAAWILASNGLRVLAMDWDLEAPGLHRFFHPFLPDRDLRTSSGVIDLMWEFATAAVDPEGPAGPDWYEKLARVAPYTVSVEHPFPGAGTVDLVPAGRQDASYAALVSTFDWGNFYDRLGGGQFLEALKRDVRDRYDYVLIDSRTGLSDTAGICTVQLPDILVNCFTFSTQSIDGAAAVAASIHRQRRGDQLRLFPVPMRVEDGEQSKLDAGRDYARKRFGRYLSHLPDPERYWGEVEVPYKSFYAYEEVLATIGDRPLQENTILAASERIVAYLTDGRVTGLAAPPTEAERRTLLARYAREGGPAPLVRGGIGFGEESPRVFVSFAYDSADHFERVRELWYVLRQTGLDARLDLAPGQRRADWSDWLAAELRAADLVVVVASPTYRRQAEEGEDGQAPRLLRDAYRHDLTRRRFVPLVLPDDSAADLPGFLETGPEEEVRLEELTPTGVEPLLRTLAGRYAPKAGRVAQPRVGPSHRPDDPRLLEAKEALAETVALQWRAESLVRELYAPDLLPLTWASTARPVSAAGVTAYPETSWHGEPRLRGDMSSIADMFLSLPWRRLVVLGEPGTGKTSSAIILVLDLLQRAGTSTDPVPVLLSLSTWDPGVESFDTWLARRLREDYPTLARLGPEAAGRLVASGDILPVLDGLDEIPFDQRDLALLALDRSTTGRPLVVISRSSEYEATVRGTGRALAKAVVIEMLPLALADTFGHLRDVSLPTDTRWSDLSVHLIEDPEQPLARALSTPLMVMLTRAAYTSPGTEPAKLLDRGRFPDQAAIESHLLAQFIPVAYARYPTSPAGEGTNYDPAKATAWLSFLAFFMTMESSRELAWWRLHEALPPLVKRIGPGLVAGVPTALTTWVVGALSSWATLFPTVPLWQAVAAVGLFTGVLAMTARPPSGPRERLGIGRWATRWRPAYSPLNALRRDRTSTLIVIMIVLAPGVLALPFSTLIWQDGTYPSALLGGFPIALLFLVRSAWGWLGLSRFWLALRGHLPWRLMRFLADAHRRGVLRQNGPVYQFRHAHLQDWLAGKYDGPRPGR
ncbi:KGGVGR-motif variant AAA ATPase [Sphaerisporangium aureirubrum]|uniref:KGGVGR-motif variant AAA ATPase n=1 Tax=Sphaerisporangium aureirubrum TaxID=1544736 RepID=A0ABW1NC74_9ACTN